MSRKPGFTVEQHRQTGETLKRITAELMALQVAINQAYPKPIVKACDRCNARLSDLRSRLDSRYAAEYPAEFSPTTYYGAEGEG